MAASGSDVCAGAAGIWRDLTNNVNQLAKHANATDEFPDEARVALGRVRAIAERMNGIIDGFAG